MNDRIRDVRKRQGLTQKAMAEKLGLSENFIFLMERGDRQPSDRTIADICREFGVSEQWLRDGTGEMFMDRSREDQIADIVHRSMQRTPEEARESLIAKLKLLDDGEILLLAEILKL